MPSQILSAQSLDAELHPEPHLAIDITSHLCPMTFVRTRLALDRLKPGQVLAVRLKGFEPRQNVPASVIELGHRIIALEDQPDGSARLLILKAGPPS